MDEPEATDNHVQHQASQLQRLLSKLVKMPKDHALADLELSQREVRLMLLLGAHPGRTMTDLATQLDAPLSTVTRMVDRLVDKHLLERFRPEENRRTVVVRATGKGIVLHSNFERHHFELARRMLQPLTPGERAILLELMEKLTRGLSDAPVDPSPGGESVSDRAAL